MALNVSTYIFGRFSSGYTQFPDDSKTRDIFGYAGNRLRAESQLYIHRDNAIIYYVFIRRLPAGKYIGLCVVFNGIYITDLKRVFTIFEETIDYCATYGYLIRPVESDPSTYEPNSAKLYLSKDDVDRIEIVNGVAFGFGPKEIGYHMERRYPSNFSHDEWNDYNKLTEKFDSRLQKLGIARPQYVLSPETIKTISQYLPPEKPSIQVKRRVPQVRAI